MKEVKYFSITVLAAFSVCGAVFWTVVPYITDYYLSKLGYAAFIFAFGLLLVGGGLLRYVYEHLRVGLDGSSRSCKVITAAFPLVGIALFYGSIGRIGLPYLSPMLDISISKAQNGEFILWYVLLALGSSIYTFGTLHRRILGIDMVSKLRSKVLGFRAFENLSADEILARDPRPPILYLRSFNRELDKATVKGRLQHWRNLMSGEAYLFSLFPGKIFYGSRSLTHALGSWRSPFDEQMIFADVFSRLGPYIAIGRPSEYFENMNIGAMKKYVGDDEWQHVILQWLSKCAAVVLEAGDSDGLSWEMEQMVKLTQPTKVLIILPFQDKDYDDFRHYTARIFPRPLRDIKASSRLLMFSSDWCPIQLTNFDYTLADTLEPFFEQNDFDITRAEPEGEGDEDRWPRLTRFLEKRVLTRVQPKGEATEGAWRTPRSGMGE
jgi:hypothetical protein